MKFLKNLKKNFEREKLKNLENNSEKIFLFKFFKKKTEKSCMVQGQEFSNFYHFLPQFAPKLAPVKWPYIKILSNKKSDEFAFKEKK